MSLDNKTFWKTSSMEIEKMTHEIRKDLEYNYRLPHNIITILIGSLKDILNPKNIKLNERYFLLFGEEIESLINKTEVWPKNSNSLILNISKLYSDALKENGINDKSEKEKIKKVLKEYFEQIREKYVDEVNLSNYILNPTLHFENGHFLHSNQYYFAKRYFQNSENCDKLSILLASKIRSLGLTNVTLIGFRNYLGLTLEKTKKLLKTNGPKIDYAIIEPFENNSFTWQSIPDFEKINTNFVIVLPITCTCSTYIRIRKFLQNQIDNFLNVQFPKGKRAKKEDWIVRRNFINVFLIQDIRLKGTEEPIDLIANTVSGLTDYNDDIQSELSRLYSDFNWNKITNDAIYFKNDIYNESYYVAYPLVKLYSDLKLPEHCENCFPKDDLKNEKNIFLTHDNFETPNLIQDFPDFGKQRSEGVMLKEQLLQLARKDLLFTKLFSAEKLKRPSHHYGHIYVNGNSYLNYIRGNTFFDQNRDSILDFFDSILNKVIIEAPVKQIADIVFITSENKHNSLFIDEIISYSPANKMSAIQKWEMTTKNNNQTCNINVLRIDSQNEFIDNFMSNYISLLQNENTLIIYFEEVFSAGITFKLLSNYLKHYKNVNHEKKELQHGFDYVFSLIDRTPYHTREEIFKKLYSRKNKDTVSRFITFFKLNVPIVSAAHLGNPLKKNVKLLNKMLKVSNLDVLKNSIVKELDNKIGIKLPEDNIFKATNTHIKFFPFEDDDYKISEEKYLKYKDFLENGKIELLKLYVAHEINSILGNNRKISSIKNNLDKLVTSGKLIEFIIGIVINKIQESKESFFTKPPENEPYVMELHEKEFVSDTVLKILSRQPFTYYNKIYDSIFKYCIYNLDIVRKAIIENNDIPAFYEIRKLKFYIKRIAELDSSYLISPEFIQLIKHLYEFRFSNGCNRIELILNEIENEILKLEKEKTFLGPENSNNNKYFLNKLRINNQTYKFNSINSLPANILYSFKVSIFKNHYRSIMLEQILNSNNLLPKLISDDGNLDDLSKQIKDPFYQITGAIKAENLFLYDNLKRLHIEKYELYEKNRIKIRKNISSNEEENLKNEIALNRLIEKWLDPKNAKSIVEYYFESWKSDPIIINAKKFLSNSRFAKDTENFYAIKLAIANMLKSSTTISDKMVSKEEVDFIEDIHEVLRSIVSIIQPNIEDDEISIGSSKSKLGYALCIKYSDDSVKKTSENIYVISSDKKTNGSQINTDGLIYNLMNGIYTNVTRDLIDNPTKSRLQGEQSLITSFRIENNWESFNDEYYYFDENKNIKKETFSNLLNKDCKIDENKFGLPIIDKSNLNLFFRLSEINHDKLDSDQFSLNGKAILIITYTSEIDRNNFLKFMSNEKVRLLLLIKEELLSYLKYITSNNTFYQLIKSEERSIYQRTLRHGIEDYFGYQEKIIDSNDFSDKNIIILKSINDAIKGQISAFDLSKNIIKEYKKDDVINRLESILESFLISGKLISKANYKINFDKVNSIKIDSFVFEIIILELIINAKRHSPNVGSGIEINFKSNSFSIKNNKKIPPPTENNRHKQGLELCEEICKSLNYKLELIKDDDLIFEATIKKIG